MECFPKYGIIDSLTQSCTSNGNAFKNCWFITLKNGRTLANLSPGVSLALSARCEYLSIFSKRFLGNKSAIAQLNTCDAVAKMYNPKLKE